MWLRHSTTWTAAPERTHHLPAGWAIMAVSPNSRFVALTAAYADRAPDNRIRMTIGSGVPEVLPGLEAKLGRACFSPDNRLLAVATFDRPLRVAIWKTAYPNTPPRLLTAAKGEGATDIAFSHDSSLLAVSDLGGCVYLWRVGKKAGPTSKCDSPELSGELAFDPAAPLLAAGSDNGEVTIFSIEHMRLQKTRMLDVGRGSITALAFDRSGRLLISASNDGQVTVWTTSTWEKLGMLKEPDGSFVRQVIPGPGENRVVTLSQGGRRLSVWDFAPRLMATRAEDLARSVELQQP